MQRISKKSRLLETYSLIFIDMLGILISYAGALWLRFRGQTGGYSQLHYSIGAYIFIIALLYSVMTEWNRGFFDRGMLVELIAILKYNAVLLLAISTIVFLNKMGDTFSRLVFGYFAVLNIVITYLLHLFFKKYMMEHYRNSASSDKVMVVTQRKYADKLMKKILEEKAWNYAITSIALVDEPSGSSEKQKIEGIPVVADGENLFEVARRLTLDEVFLYLPGVSIETVKEIIQGFETMGVTCHYNVEIPELNLEGKTAGNFAGYAVMTFSLQYLDYRRMLLKRGVDIFGSIVGLCMTAVLIPFVALAIKIESKGPVFFSQIRIGKNGRRFKIWKFRSMYMNAEERKKDLEQKNEMQGLMFKIEDDPRITKVGKFIRKTSIDELPQFFNILKGDMSLVGTRPPTVDEFERYNIHYRRRLSITPGLTGMWQVSGRNEVNNFDEVVKLDLEYIENWSLRLDIKILLQTIGVVLFGKGAK
ncbi:MAG: sugar transferase [Lachnospiraceae bacterium]